MSSNPDSPDGDPGFQIAPMVDVVFVLMLFFMACAGMQVKEKELKIALPSDAPFGGADIGLIVIDITPDGQVSMNNEVFGAPGDHDLARLRAWFKTAIEQFGDADPVIIRPQSDARHERIVDVLNAASEAGVKHLTFS